VGSADIQQTSFRQHEEDTRRLESELHKVQAQLSVERAEHNCLQALGNEQWQTLLSKIMTQTSTEQPHETLITDLKTRLEKADREMRKMAGCMLQMWSLHTIHITIILTLIAIAILNDAISRTRLDAQRREAQFITTLQNYMNEHDHWMSRLLNTLTSQGDESTDVDPITASCENIQHLFESVGKASNVAINRIKSIGGTLSKSAAMVFVQLTLISISDLVIGNGAGLW